MREISNNINEKLNRPTRPLASTDTSVEASGLQCYTFLILVVSVEVYSDKGFTGTSLIPILGWLINFFLQELINLNVFVG